MIFGYDYLESNFKRLSDDGELARSYIFFGEPQIGKFCFAIHLANYLENGLFSEPKFALKEALIIEQSKGGESSDESKESVGIEKIRELERFLRQTPIASKYRIAIIRDGEWLTDQAQNALLKIFEEPPEHGIIIITANDPTVFLQTLQSRAQKIFFRTLSRGEMDDFLKKANKSKISNNDIISESFGRIGRAMCIISENKEKAFVKANAEAKKIMGQEFINNPEKFVDDVLDSAKKNPFFLDIFFEEIILILRKNTIKNCSILNKIGKKLQILKTLNTNKRIQLKDILWNLRSHLYS